MGIAWFDDAPPPPEEPTLRTGGPALLPAGLPWPECPRCGVPMLFRAQIPLVLTSLVAFDDDRLLGVFECHAVAGGTPCDGARAVLVGGDLAPRPAPDARALDVVLTAMGPDPAAVRRVLTAVEAGAPGHLPATVLRELPPSIAAEAVRAVADAGGTARSRASPPTMLATVHGGSLVPFDEGLAGAARTTLPPVGELLSQAGSTAMRGLVGGATPGYRDHSIVCDCGRPTRTAVRLLASREADLTGVRLGPAVVQLCPPCSAVHVFRSSPMLRQEARVSIH